MKKETIHDLLPRIDEFHAALTQEVRQYLNGRGISDPVIDRRKIGQCVHNNQQWIVVPIADAKGVVKQVVLRRLPDAPEGQKRYINPKESRAALLGADSLQADPDTILWGEGVLDALATESLGICAVSGTAGAGTLHESWFDYILKTSRRRKLIACFDKDDAGVKGGKELLFKVCQILFLLQQLALHIIGLPWRHEIPPRLPARSHESRAR